jgi:hypothetical protein
LNAEIIALRIVMSVPREKANRIVAVLDESEVKNVSRSSLVKRVSRDVRAPLAERYDAPVHWPLTTH